MPAIEESSLGVHQAVILLPPAAPDAPASAAAKASFAAVSDAPVSIDEIIGRALLLCQDLPAAYAPCRTRIEDLRDRLATGRLHLAVLGQFNRGKSTFLNALLGLPVLPTSVLPLTNVPTVIRYGAELSCTIRFLSGKPDRVVRSSAEEIRAALMHHVTEDRNPKNRENVREAVVECPAEFLENGTVLIDTPGFGSTHVHNTKTTVDLLCECDAAFLLLSADLPITQFEIEFLKEVRKYVPRLFFIFNKVDLLAEHELIQTDVFIKKTIAAHFGYSTDLILIPVSARAALESKSRDESDAAWKKSGMEQVKKAVDRFLSGEKYFTLSYALRKKFGVALDGIAALLKRDRAANAGPIENREREYREMVQHRESLSSVLARESEMVQAEKRALVEFIESAGAREIRNAEAETAAYLNALCAGSGDPSASIRSTFPAFVDQTVRRIGAALVASVNKPLRKAAALHQAAVECALATVAACAGEAVVRQVRECLAGLDEFDMAAPESAPMDIAAALGRLKAGFGDHFMRAADRLQARTDRYLPVLCDLLRQKAADGIVKVKKESGAQTDMFAAIVEKSLDPLLRACRKKEAARHDAWQEALSAATPRLETLTNAQRELAEIRLLLGD
jgi:GTP-binding protein EngB required for normal cell division